MPRPSPLENSAAYSMHGVSPLILLVCHGMRSMSSPEPRSHSWRKKSAAGVRALGAHPQERGWGKHFFPPPPLELPLASHCAHLKLVVRAPAPGENVPALDVHGVAADVRPVDVPHRVLHAKVPDLGGSGGEVPACAAAERVGAVRATHSAGCPPRRLCRGPRPYLNRVVPSAAHDGVWVVGVELEGEDAVAVARGRGPEAGEHSMSGVRGGTRRVEKRPRPAGREQGLMAHPPLSWAVHVLVASS